MQPKEDCDLSSKVISPDVIDQIRAEDARRFRVIPVGYESFFANPERPSDDIERDFGEMTPSVLKCLFPQYLYTLEARVGAVCDCL